MSAVYRKYGLGFAVAVAVIGIAAAVLWLPVAAQTSGWTTPQLVFEGRGTLNTPTLVADDYGQVHAFWLFQADQLGNADTPPLQLYYTRLDRPAWPPTDILIGQTIQLPVKAAMMRDGLALLWGGNIFTWSGISPGPTARAWASPVTLQPVYPEAGLAVAPDGALWTIGGAGGTNEIYVQRLNPDTRVWEAPRLVSDPVNVNVAPDGTRLAISADGTLHAVWAEYQLPNGWPPIGLYYARSSDGGQTWSSPRKIAGSNFNQPNVLAGPDQQVYVVWTGTAGTGMKYFQESLDGGHTWADPVMVMKQLGGGSEGAPNLAVDSAGNPHMVFSHNGCVWHVSRENNVWSDPECISSGTTANSDVETPAMALGLGNTLHVLYWTDHRQLWYTSRVLDVPSRAPLPTPTAVIATATVLAPTVTPVPTGTPLPNYGPFAQPGQATQPGVWAMVAGVAPVVLLFFVVALFRKQSRQ